MVTIVLVTRSGPKCPRKPYYTLLQVTLVKSPLINRDDRPLNKNKESLPLELFNN